MTDLARLRRGHFRRVLFSLPLLSVFFCLGTSGPGAQSAQYPGISRLELQGKRLIATGGNFDEGAVIQVEGERQRTRPDPDSPATVLIAKRAGINFGRNTPTGITVRNHDGLTSNELFIYKTDTFAA